MHNKGYAASSIPPKLSAVAFVHKLLNFPDPTQSFIIQKLVRASRKSQTPDGRRPITPSILKALLDAIPSVTSHAYDRQLFKALFLFSYHSLSRIGEVTVTGAANHTLQLSDINSQASHPHSILVTFRTYKHGNPSRPATISISPNTGSSYCPVASLKSYLTIRGNRAGCLFLRSDGRPVSSDLFSHTLRKCVKHVELDPREFTAHSFRIGAATHAALSGVPDKQLRALGRWSSDAFRSYIRP
ncbi:uncharacterized protein [Branchiostoma lanceolatum]|uniref:uncharacterized protein n=1 Tax=Branchiostoma lanceolatum TaxID=7740 RepID=UPI003452057B